MCKGFPLKLKVIELSKYLIKRQSSFSFIGFVKFVKFFEMLVFCFNKHTYELCTCVNMEIYTSAKNFNTPVLITTCDIPSQILVTK